MLCTVDEEGNLCSMLGVRYESLDNVEGFLSEKCWY